MSYFNLKVQTKKSSLLHKTSLVVLFFLALFSVFSPVRALPAFNQIWALGVLSWYFITIIDSPKFLLRPSFFKYSIFFFIIYTVLIPYLLGNPKIGNRFFEISQVFLFYLAYLKNKTIGRNKDNILIIKFIFPFVVFTSLATIYAYHFTPYISRAIKTGTEVGTDALVRGVGGYEFIYFLVIVSVLLISSLNYRKYFPFNKLFFLFISLLFAYNIIMSNYSTALMLLILSIIMTLFIRNVSASWMAVNISFVIIVFFFGLQYVSDFFDLLANILGDTMNSSRMMELNQLVSTNETGNSIAARMYTYNRSIEAFIKSPLFGVINNELSLNIGQKGFGQHSQILDCFALFGAFLGTLQLYLFIQPFYIKLRTNSVILKKLAFITFTVFILLVTINNITPSIGFAAFFIFPTIYDWMEEKLRIKQPVKPLVKQMS